MTPDPADIRALVHEYIDTVWNDGNHDAVAEYIADDYTIHVPQGDLDRDGYRRMIAEEVDAFADPHMEIERILVDGDWYAVRYTVTTDEHVAPYMGVEPTGTTVETSGVAMGRIEDGVIVEEWVVNDTLDFAVQLGAVDPPRPATD